MWRSIRDGGGRADACLGVARGAVAFVGGLGATPQVEAFDMMSGATQRAPDRPRTDNEHDLRSAVRRACGMDGRARGGASIVVGNDLACHWLLAPPTGARSLGEIQAVAHARFAELFAERPDEWVIAGDWRSGLPFVCTAVPKWVVAGIHAAMPDTMPAVRTGTVLGRALELFHRRLPTTGWCCVNSPCSLALMHVRDGLPDTLRVTPVVDRATRDGVFAAGAEALQREAARRALPPVVNAIWLDLKGQSRRDASTPSRDHSGVAFRVLHLDHGDEMTKSAAVAAGAEGEATVAAYLGAGSGVGVS